MPKFFISNSQIQQNKIKIKGQDVKHIKNVLRAQIGENLQICNNDTSENYNCKITNIKKEEIEVEIIEKEEKQTEPQTHITIFQGLPKADKMEYIIQKAVELGVYKITPIEMKRSIVKIQEKDKHKKVERWQKISEVAAKQSGRNIIPQINEIININKLSEIIKDFDIFWIAYEKEKINKLKEELTNISKKEKTNAKIGILIGPEGGIADEEITKLTTTTGAKTITLGNRILRTETVALNLLSIILYELES